MTVATVVNAWGFGCKIRDNDNPQMMDSIREFGGSEKIELADEKIIKTDPRVMLDASAIAKGYASDVIGDFLASKGIENYMVEIGGEFKAAGVNPSGKCWRIAINKPVEYQSGSQGEIEEVIPFGGGGLSTSGNDSTLQYKHC